MLDQWPISDNRPHRGEGEESLYQVSDIGNILKNQYPRPGDGSRSPGPDPSRSGWRAGWLGREPLQFLNIAEDDRFRMPSEEHQHVGS